jgi:hypothetical protein
MKRYNAVEVTRTVTYRRTIIVCAKDKGAAHDVDVKNAESEIVRAPWISSRTGYSTEQTTEIDWPGYVDVTAKQQPKWKRPRLTSYRR